MIDVITTRTSIQEWKNELNRVHACSGIRRKDEIYERLEEGMNSLVSLINDFRGANATLIQPGYRDEFIVGLRVECDGMDDAFFAYVAYSNIDDKKLECRDQFTERPSTRNSLWKMARDGKWINMKRKR